MEADTGLNGLLNRLVQTTFKDALRASVKDPVMMAFFLRTLKAQKKAMEKRQASESEGLHVPPLMILSVTDQCNLHCQGCYSQNLHRETKAEMSAARLESLFGEAEALGTAIILLAGGEPLLKPGLLDLTKKFPGIVFPLLTNGTLLDETIVSRVKEQRNVIPMLSIEGYEGETDLRRGAGTYGRVLVAMEKLQKAGIFFGVSITVTRSNFSTVTGDAFVKGLLDMGCKAFFYVEYSPVRPGTESWVPTPEQREVLVGDTFRSKYPAAAERNGPRTSTPPGSARRASVSRARRVPVSRR
jgi:MoaA/NifB/PqqE/SkfB family radical SAM enzyme